MSSEFAAALRVTLPQGAPAREPPASRSEPQASASRRRPQAAASLQALLRAASRGEDGAFDQLFTCVYDELHGLAHVVRAGRGTETIDTTALVHEAYLKLLPSASLEWQDRKHFLAVAARAMRQVLMAAARDRLAQKRGGGEVMVTFDEGVHGMSVRVEELLDLDDALHRLALLDERQARIVEYRFFAGLNVEETARALGLSVPTVNRDWRAARAWLARELAPNGR
ncbi:MAG: ECF-type sigma factor [Gemmatimonadaceae bacterium]